MAKERPLEISVPSQGWMQFLTARQEMLDAYDSAREKSKKHKVEVFHGKVAEARFRKWLGDFLPKRFGVTSGYITSQGFAFHVVVIQTPLARLVHHNRTPSRQVAETQSRSPVFPAPSAFI